MSQSCPVPIVPSYLGRPRRGLVALVAGLVLSLGLAAGLQAATTWTVCANGCNYTSIKTAIAAPGTLNGDMLAIAAGTYTEAGITVNKSLMLQGEAANTTIVQAAATQGTASDRVLTIASGVTVTLQALTIRHGTAWDFTGGGGLYNMGTLTLSHSIVQGNAALYGDCTPDGKCPHGGGIRNNGTLTLTQSIVQGNVAVVGGGGVFNEGIATLTFSTITGNSTGYGAGGGGLFNYNGTLALTESTVRANTADWGGGLANIGTLTLINSTLSGNSAEAYGGGLYNEGFSPNQGIATLTNSTISDNSAPSGWGGGLFNFGSVGMLTLINSTVSGNSAPAPGGGLANFGAATFTNSTVTSNESFEGGGGLYNDRGCCPSFGGQIQLTNSLVAENPYGGDCQSVNDASITSMGYNLDSDGSCQLTAPTDRPDVNPRLGPLQDNGGSTFTQALLPGSPALDVIPWGTNGCGTTLISDQRWQARPQPAGGACDIGAYEVVVAGQALSAWVTGLTLHTAGCENVTTGQAVTLSDPVSPWNCETAGLGVSPGDHVRLRVQGPVKQGATDVGGAVTGMTPSSGGCKNITTGQQVSFQHMVGATAGSCVAAGLVVQWGDSVQMRVQGVAE